jgi:hypothetical protein
MDRIRRAPPARRTNVPEGRAAGRDNSWFSRRLGGDHHGSEEFFSLGDSGKGECLGLGSRAMTVSEGRADRAFSPLGLRALPSGPRHRASPQRRADQLLERPRRALGRRCGHRRMRDRGLPSQPSQRRLGLRAKDRRIELAGTHGTAHAGCCLSACIHIRVCARAHVGADCGLRNTFCDWTVVRVARLQGSMLRDSRAAG